MGIGYDRKPAGIKNTDAEMRDAVVNDATKFAGANLALPEIIENIFDVDMGYWAEVDIGAGRVLIDYTNERIAITDLDDDEDVYVYKATTANVADFLLDFQYQVLSTTTVAGSSFGIGLADSIGTMEDVNNGLYARTVWNGVNDHGSYIYHMTGGAHVLAGPITGLLDDTVYYGRLLRRGSYCWLGIFSDRIRETHVAGSPLEYKDDTPIQFTHLYPMTAFDSGGTAGEDMDAYVKAIKLLSAPDIDKYYLGRHII